jgi:SnoaL-like domain
MTDPLASDPESPGNPVNRFADAVSAFETGTGTVREIVELYASECVAGNVVRDEVHEGHEGVAQFWNAYRDQFGEVRSTYLVVSGDDCGGVVEWDTSGRVGDADVSYRGATVLEIEGGLVVRSMAYFDTRAFGDVL